MKYLYCQSQKDIAKRGAFGDVELRQKQRKFSLTKGLVLHCDSLDVTLFSVFICFCLSRIILHMSPPCTDRVSSFFSYYIPTPVILLKNVEKIFDWH